MKLVNILILFLTSMLLIACDEKGETKMSTLTKAPEFKLLDENSQEHKLSDYKDQYVLIYFYPKDDTPGCTKEACTIKDNYQGFKERNIKVFGISPDSPESHKKFKEKYQLPFTLLSDNGKKVAKLYNADGIFTKRISYLIAPNGDIKKFYPDVDPASHAQEILNDYDRIKENL